MGSLSLAAQETADSRLHLRFRGELDMFRVPFEFLPSKAVREHLVLRHPLARTVIGERVPFPKKPGLSRRFFNELYRRNDSLGILAIASDTPPALPRVDHEVQALADKVPELFKAKKIKVTMKCLPSKDATYEAVVDELKSGKYDVVHYAGHGVYDHEAPEESYLPLRETRGENGGVKPLRVPALRWALEDSKVRFVYLSCCVGAAQAEPMKLQDYDFLGITDGLLQAGIPSVLGYRWPVGDLGGEKLAVAFYKYLAQEGETDAALLLLDARFPRIATTDLGFRRYCFCRDRASSKGGRDADSNSRSNHRTRFQRRSQIVRRPSASRGDPGPNWSARMVVCEDVIGESFIPPQGDETRFWYDLPILLRRPKTMRWRRHSFLRAWPVRTMQSRWSSTFFRVKCWKSRRRTSN